MDKLKIEKNSKTNDSVTRTIRISGRTFDKINELATENEISFNCVVNQIIEFVLHNLDEKYFFGLGTVLFAKRTVPNPKKENFRPLFLYLFISSTNILFNICGLAFPLVSFIA